MDLELYIDRIEQYETGALNDAGRTQFETELAENPDLKEALALYRQANAAIEQNIENSLRAQLQQWNAEDRKMTAQPGGARIVSMRSNWMRWAVAASVTLLVGWFGFQYAGSHYSNQALYLANYEKPADSAFRAGTPGEHPLQAGFDALQAGNLTAALTFFKTIPPENERYAEAQYYLGHAAMQAGQYDAALIAFQRVTERHESKFQEKAEWNLLLCYVATGLTGDPSFKALLGRVAASPEHSYQEQARALQEKLGSVWRLIGQK